MKINEKEVSVNEAIKFSNYDNLLLKHRNNGLLLSDYQLDILKRNDFDINKYSSMQELLFDIEDYLNEEYDLELDLVSSQLAEFIYYRDTKK
jgi:hypothetical protein